MGLVYTEIELINTNDIAYAKKGFIAKKEIRKTKIKVLVDSGALLLCINERIKNQLGLETLNYESAIFANGQIEKYEIAGPVTIIFENRNTICRTIVLPGDTECLLGAIPMEDMDVVIEPKKQKLIVHPEHPYMAQKSLK